MFRLHTLAQSPMFGRAMGKTPGGVADDPLLAFAGPVEGAHALIIAADGLELLCRLLQHGCEAATALRPAKRPEAETYDLVFAPAAGDPATADRLVCLARRALVPAGRLVACVPKPSPADPLLQAMRAGGFTAIRTKPTPDGTLVRGDFAIHGWSSALPRLAVRRQA